MGDFYVLFYCKCQLTDGESKENLGKGTAGAEKKRGYLYKYYDMAQNVLERLLERYMDEGITDLENPQVLELDDFKEFGSPLKIVKLFGNKKKYIEAVKELEKEIYA